MISSPDLLKFRNSLQEAEGLYDVNRWQVNDIQVWPLIRHKISYQYLRMKGGRPPFIKLITGRISMLLKGIPELLVLLWKFKMTKNKTAYLFVTKAAYRVFTDNAWYEKFCDSTIDLMGDDFKEKSSILEGSVDLMYKTPRYKSSAVFAVQGVYYLIGLLAEFSFRIRKPSRQLEQYDDFINFLNIRNDQKVSLSKQNLILQAYRIYSLSIFFEFLLKSLNVKKIFTVCYYEESGYAMMLAAHRLGITSVDIQHGVQGSFHFAYLPFQNIPKAGYALLPDYFWVWNKASAENIAAWRSLKHRPFMGGNLWLAKWSDKSFPKRSERQMILVTLQPIADVLPQFLLDSIAETADRYSWFLRLHPRQMPERERIENILKSASVLNSVELIQATQQPLPLLLQQAAVHITQWSSVVIEAAEFGVPSILIHPTGKLIFTPEEFGQNFIHYAENKQQICDALNKLPGKSERLIFKLSKEKISDFLTS